MAGRVAERRTIRRPAISERSLRPIAHSVDLTEQKILFQKLLGVGQ